MDNDTSVLQGQRSNGSFNGFHRLKWLNPERIREDGVDLQDLWRRVSVQDYAFDDFSRGKVEWFLAQLADISGTVRIFLIDNAGVFMVTGNMQEGGDATVHFIIWDRNFSLHQDKEPAYELCDWLFYDVKVHRIYGPIPDYNKLASRFAFSMGMKFEGEMQEAVRWHGKYYNIKMFGLLEPWYSKRKEIIKI